MSKGELRVLPKALKYVRAQRGLSQKELAQMTGRSLALIALIETGDRQPSLETAEAIATALGVEVGVFAFVPFREVAA